MSATNRVYDMPASDEDLRRKNACPDCERDFSTPFNLRRHRACFHKNVSDDETDSVLSQNDSEEEEMETENSEYESENSECESEDSADESENSECESEDSEDENDDPSVFDDLVDDTVSLYDERKEERINDLMANGMEEKEAESVAHQQLLPFYKKTLRCLFVNYVNDMFRKRSHPLFKDIISKIEKYEKKGFNPDEAIKAAVSYRKHAIDNLIPL